MPSALFTPFTLGSVTARNRVWVSPMCQYSVEERDGVPTHWHLVHLGSFARGGAGLVMTEATAVVPEGRISAWDTGIWNEAQAEAWRPIAAFIRSQGAIPAMQLAHAGRKASTWRDWSGSGSLPISEGGWQTVAPTAEAFWTYDPPRALTAAEIAGVVRSFAAAARRAVEAGFEVVEIHAAHGYLIHQFLSPLANSREDEWGGSLENRARFFMEVLRAVLAAVEVPVVVRVSATDWVEPDGLTLAETVTVAQWAREAGADLYDVSTGGVAPGIKIPTAPSYQVPFATAIREGNGIPVGAVGQITNAVQAEEIVFSGAADVVFVARQFLRDPHLPLRWAHELGAEIEWPAPYRRASRWV
ncbi:MAG: NADH:flavin oxidoreductase/NADH oxidase [Ruaniaceae bacterium]|nr:NADH:flavin oxidoreductase/NADH oxidase [Ruaniaceae bacterium]